ncbi:MAG: GNAT family N-acetyltransferase [Syntrophomonadaceae bacterium]|jgi:GNAT superfamily N-acetyltransferase
MNLQITEIKEEKDLLASVKVIRESFATVAKEFKLTKECAPTNAAFIEFEDLLRIKEQGVCLFGLNKEGVQIGFFSIEDNPDGLYYLNKLAVLPAYRHKGYGGFILNMFLNT